MMEEDDEEAIAVLRLRSWSLCMQGVTHSSLSPSLARLLLLQSPSGSARIVGLSRDDSAALGLPHTVSASAWACREDCYSHGGGDEFLFTGGSSGLVIYGFRGAQTPNEICEMKETDLIFDAAGRARLAFADGPPLVSFTIAYDSPCFSALLAATFGNEQQQGAVEVRSITRLISSSADLVAMCCGDEVILLSKVDEAGVHWTGGISLSAWAGEPWVDFCFVQRRFLGLTTTGNLFLWDAVTGEQQQQLSVQAATYQQLLPAHTHARPLVGLLDTLGRIFLLPLGNTSCWQVAAGSDISSAGSELKVEYGPSAFTPKRLLAACSWSGRSDATATATHTKLLRHLLLPLLPPSSTTVAAIGSSTITSLSSSVNKDGRPTPTLVQHGLYSDSQPATRSRYAPPDVLGLACQGSLYLISPTFLAVVLPPFVSATDPSLLAAQWWSTTSTPPSLLLTGLPSTRSLRHWQMALLDRCLIYDGLKDAEYLFMQNGWSLRLARLRKLELALYYLRPDEVEPLLSMLVPVCAAEAGLLRVIFTSMKLMLNRFGTDNELALASRLLALAARFTMDLLKDHESKTGVSPDFLSELARLLETIRMLQEHLHLRRKGTKTEKGDPGTEFTDKVENKHQALSVSTAVEEFGTGLVPSEEEGSSRRHRSQESPKEMIARWEKEQIDVSGIVKDALRAGRLPLAVVQLHHRRRESSTDEIGSKKLEAHVFKEVQDAGRSIVYELLCKGKLPLALAALRRLGENIRAVLHDLAFGTVRRSLRCLTITELRRHGHLDTTDYQLISTMSRIEDAYPSSKFWSSYNTLQQPRHGSRQDLQMYSLAGASIVQCGEIDGVVFGSWCSTSGNIAEDEVLKDENGGAYWAGALVWLQDLDQQTIDRMLLEQSPNSDVSWESKLKFSVVHHRWSSVSRLISDIRSVELQEMELKVTTENGMDVVVIPKVKHLIPDLEACTGWLWNMIERMLAKKFIFLRQSWSDVVDLLSLLSHAGLIFDKFHTQELLQLVATHCMKHNLPWLLELYLEKHSTSLSSVVHDNQWQQWLVFSRQQGSQYSAAFANARTVLTCSISTLDDIASSGSDIMALATLVYAPVLPQKCLYAGVKRPHAGKSWQCALQHLQLGLKDYPTLWNVLKSRCIGASTTRRIGYLQWRKSLFSSGNADTSLMRMLPRWIPKTLRKALHMSMQGLSENSFTNAVSWEESVNRSMEYELVRSGVQISSNRIEQFLLRGCPLAAFQYLLRLRVESGTGGNFSVLENREEESLKVVMPLAIRNFKNRAVTAACALLLELCGINATVLRCYISVLQRISRHASGEHISRRLAELLSDEYTRKGPTGHIEDHYSALVLEHLERATMGMMNTTNGCGLWLKNGQSDGQQFRIAQMCMSANWNLVTTFCKVHHLPQSTCYLSYLARDNDWVGFLAEAQAESCPLDVLLSVAFGNFTDDRLRSHIVTVLKSSSRSDKTIRNEAFQSDVGGNLFYLLAEAERSKSPGTELLAKAKDLSWPLLTVVASCFSDVSPLACLAAWLEVTAARETSWLKLSDGAGQLMSCVGTAVDATNATGHLKSHAPVFVRTSTSKRRRLISPELEEEFNASSLSTDASYSSQKGSVSEAVEGIHEFLTKMVAVLCEQQRFIPLLRAFELFLPASPLLHFIRFLRAFSQMRLSEASAHLADFSTLLKDEIHQSRGVRTSTTWISKAAIAGANSVLAACPSVYEKRCMLQLLAAADFGDGGVAAMAYRKHYWKMQLAEPLLRQGRSSMVQTSDLDDEDLLNELEKSGQWEEARSWARQLDLGQQESSNVHHVTEMQAEAMVTEWKELLWDVPEQRAALWRHCQALFTKHLYPPLKAGMFFLKHAEDVEHHGLAVELHAVLLLALQWLSGSITGSPPVYPVHLLRELETRVWLLAVESEVLFKTSTSTSIASLRLGALNLESSSFGMPSSCGSPVDRTATKIAAVDGHLKVFSSMHMEFTEDLAAIRQAKPVQKDSGPKPKRRLVRRIYSGMEQTANDTGERKATDEESATGWEDKVGEGEVERAILALVEVGQVSAARQLQLKLLPNRVPSELAFAETALSIAMLSSPTVKGSVRGSVLGASVMKTLNSLANLKDLSSASPLQVMEALTGACREGCGRGHCRRVSAVAQIANFLDLPFFEAFQKQPTELLQLLSLKGQDALAEAKLLVATHSINPASIARILAESFFKGLLAAHRGGYMDSSSSREEGPAPLLWRSSDFVLWAQLCPSEPELGHALMRLVISGHDMPHACEVELLILAHQFYDSSACLDGMDVLVALAATRVESYVSEGDFNALARLVTGVSNFQALRFVLDLVIENGQLELLLKKRASTVEASKESSASVRGFRMAVLSALRHFNAHDLDAFGMVYTHFSMAHEMANLLESRGRKGLNHRFIWNDPDQNEELLEVMRFFVDASEVYAGIDCGNKTRWCCAQASLLSLQLRMPELLWLNLTETNARRLLVEQRRFQEAVIVAEAYSLNQPAEWVPVLWNQVLSPGWIEHFLREFVASLPLRASMLMELARIYRSEVTARGDHLDFSKWLTSGMPPEITKSFRCILRHVGDFRLRTQLTTLASGFPDVLDVCARILDKVPDTAGPLVLKRGHGQTYVPLM